MSVVSGARPRRVSHAEAADILAARDPVVAGLIAAAGPIRIGRRTASHFAALVQAVVYQQLAGAAARAIHGRLVAALDDVKGAAIVRFDPVIDVRRGVERAPRVAVGSSAHPRR